MDAAILDALEIGCCDLGCFDTHSVLDAVVLDATVVDGTILDVVNTPYEGDFGCFLEVMNVGCCGFGCCVNWMLRSWMLQYSPLMATRLESGVWRPQQRGQPPNDVTPYHRTTVLP